MAAACARLRRKLSQVLSFSVSSYSFVFVEVFQIYYCMHVTFYRLWQSRDTLQRALMIQIDYFTTGRIGQALRLVKGAFQPR